MRLLIAVALLAWGATVAGEPVTMAVAGPSSGAVNGAVVILDPLDTRVTPRAPGMVAGTIDQIDKHFMPRIAVFQTGTAVSFPNSDRIRHQVYSFSPARPFNLKLYAGIPAAPVVFDHPGLVVLGCNIHDTMVGFVAIVNSPYFGRTDVNGRVTIEAPPGHYRLRIWHPDFAEPVAPRNVDIGNEAQTVVVAAELAPQPTTVSAWTD